MQDKGILLMFATMKIWTPLCYRMPCLKQKFWQELFEMFWVEYFSNLFVAIEMLFIKISVLTGKNTCEVFWKVDIPGLEFFIFDSKKALQIAIFMEVMSPYV